MNILFVNNFFSIFAQSNCGASQRSMRLIKALAKQGHVDVISFAGETVSNIENVDVVFSTKMYGSIESKGRLDKFAKLFKIKSPEALYPTCKQKEEIVDEIIKQKQYDCIVTRYIHFACYCGLLKYSDRLIIDMDDDPKDVVLMTMDKVRSFRNKLYMYLYAHTIDSVSKYICRNVRHVFFSSPEKAYPNASFLPNTSVFEEPLPFVDYKKQDEKILVVGWFDYLPNFEGLTHFAERVFPLIRRKVPTATLEVVGKMTDNTLIELCKKVEGIHICGFVEDLRDAYLSCRCVVVPLYRGTGTSVKLVEAMSLGRSVVATQCGLRGLHPEFQSGKDYLLATSDEEFADNVICLLHDEMMNKAIANSAMLKIQKYYSTASFDRIVNEALKNSICKNS